MLLRLSQRARGLRIAPDQLWGGLDVRPEPREPHVQLSVELMSSGAAARPPVLVWPRGSSPAGPQRCHRTATVSGRLERCKAIEGLLTPSFQV